MSNETYTDGDIIIHVIDLVSLDGQRKLSIAEQVQNIVIYESILSPIIFAKISIVDNISLRESFPILGLKAKVKISFNSPFGQIKRRSFELVISEIGNVNILQNGYGSSYDIHLCSSEILENAHQLQSRAYRDDTVENHVKDVLQNLLKTSKKINADPYGTKGIQHFDFASMRPFQTIDCLKRKAVSNQFKSNVYTFFENKDGFNLMPIEYLLSAKERLIGDAVFFYDSDTRTSLKNITYRNILAYNHIVQDSPSKFLDGGALNNTTTSFDVKTKTFQRISHKGDDNDFKTVKNSKPLSSSSFDDKYGGTPARTFNQIQNSNNPENYGAEKMGRSSAFIEQLTQNILRVMVWGDSYLSAGYRVKIEAPRPTGITKEGGKQSSENSSFVSGEFLVSHISHTISKVNLKFRYFNSLELINPSYSFSGGISG